MLFKCVLELSASVYDDIGTIVVTDMALEHVLYTRQGVKTCCPIAAMIRNGSVYDEAYGIECVSKFNIYIQLKKAGGSGAEPNDANFLKRATVVLYTYVTKVLAPWLKFIVQLALSQPPPIVLKAEMESQETEPSNFYSSLLI